MLTWVCSLKKYLRPSSQCTSNQDVSGTRNCEVGLASTNSPEKPSGLDQEDSFVTELK